MSLSVTWRCVLERLDEAPPLKASEISRKCREDGMSTGISTEWVSRCAMPAFEREGFVSRVRGSTPPRWLRTARGTLAVAEALDALHLAAKHKLASDFERNGLSEFFPESSASHSYEAQREAIRLGWIAVARHPSPKVAITEVGHEVLASATPSQEPNP